MLHKAIVLLKTGNFATFSDLVLQKLEQIEYIISFMTLIIIFNSDLKLSKVQNIVFKISN